MSYWLAKNIQNLISQSNDLTDALWTKVNANVSSDGTSVLQNGVPLYKIISTDDGAASYVYDSVYIADNTVYVLSAYYKPGTSGIARIQSNFAFNGYILQYFYPNSGTLYTSVASNATLLESWIDDLGNDEYRISMAFLTSGVSSNNSNIFLIATDNSGDIYYGGPQLRVPVGNTYRGPYYKTTGTANDSSDDLVQIHPSFDFKTKVQMLYYESILPTLVNRTKHGQRVKGHIPAQFVNSSDRAAISSWWNNNEQLLWVQDHLAYGVFSSTIINEEIPLGDYAEPYNNEWSGVIELEGY